MDTTVILAQPRVSRLRADVVYVVSVGLRSGSVRAPFGQAGALLCRQSNGQFGPPKIVYLSRILMQQIPRKIRWVGGSGVHPVYAYYFHPQHGEGYNLQMGFQKSHLYSVGSNLQIGFSKSHLYSSGSQRPFQIN